MNGNKGGFWHYTSMGKDQKESHRENLNELCFIKEPGFTTMRLCPKGAIPPGKVMVQHVLPVRLVLESPSASSHYARGKSYTHHIQSSSQVANYGTLQRSCVYSPMMFKSSSPVCHPGTSLHFAFIYHRSLFSFQPIEAGE